MSVLTPKRVFLVVAVTLLASAASAANPSPRNYARMAHDAQSDATILFGGRVGVDLATGRAYASDETWAFVGKRWLQLFPSHHPEARSVHAMAYDSKEDRIVLFGGRVEIEDQDAVPPLLADTWEWTGSDWVSISTPTAPAARLYHSMVYDAARDRIVLYGGEVMKADGSATEPTYDTWEYDGTTWTHVGTDGEAKVLRPVLGYDTARNKTVMLGLTSSGATAMYIYNPTTQSWVEEKPAAVPPCVNEGILVYRAQTGNLFFSGGICVSDNTGTVDNFEWNGTTWVKLTANEPGRISGLATSYDIRRDDVIIFGGTSLGASAPRAVTLLFELGTWRFSAVVQQPAPRSLGAFRTDTDSKSVYLLGGLSSDSSFFISDFWRYSNGQWNPLAVTGMPSACETPLSAWDSTRKVLVVVCEGIDVFEFSGTAWKSVDPTKSPLARNFAGLVYDENLKKTVMFGGYDTVTGNFRNDTWTWDGTAWTEVKESRPTHRGLMAMWYDPLMKKTVIYGGLGRPDIDSKVTRYEDMWAFSGTGWTKLNVSTTPGLRFGAATAIDPRSGKLLLFGGLRAEEAGKDSFRQFYANDLWQWDGAASTWTALAPAATLPSARENAMLAWDPIAENFVLFGGYTGGLYYSDVWIWDGQNWTPRGSTPGRRRAVGGQ